MTKKNLPDSGGPEDERWDRDGPTVNIENFNHQTNDLDSFRRLAEVSPELAEKYLNNSDKSDAREARSTNIAMYVTGSLAVFGLVVAGYVLVSIGVVQTVVFIAAILGVAHLLRVILTGEWSPTSWVGQLLGDRESGKNVSDD